jgi:hypothetical protein
MGRKSGPTPYCARRRAMKCTAHAGGMWARVRDDSGQYRDDPGAARQPHHDHRLGDAGDDHDGAGHHDRQRRPAAHGRISLGLGRPDHLGPDLLHHRHRDHDPDDRLAGGSAGHQAGVRHLDHRLLGRFGPVRRGPEPRADRPLPRAAGYVRRGDGSSVPGRTSRHLSARGARPGHGGLGNGHHGRPDYRPGARRLADRRLLLALGVLH